MNAGNTQPCLQQRCNFQRGRVSNSKIPDRHTRGTGVSTRCPSIYSTTIRGRGTHFSSIVGPTSHERTNIYLLRASFSKEHTTFFVAETRSPSFYAPPAKRVRFHDESSPGVLTADENTRYAHERLTLIYTLLAIPCVVEPTSYREAMHPTSSAD